MFFFVETSLNVKTLAFRLVEEFMLLANMATATHIYEKFPELALLRRHPPPKAKMVMELQALCSQLGLNIDFTSAGSIHVSTFK